MYKQANEMRNMHKQVAPFTQDGRGKHIVIPASMRDLRNANVNHKHVFPPQYGALILYFPVSSSSEWPSPWANLVENENYLNILGEAQGELCALRAPFHLPCLRLHAELLHDLSLLPGSQRENEVEISSGDIYVCECVCVCVCVKMHRHTHTDVHTGSISVQS